MHQSDDKSNEPDPCQTRAIDYRSSSEQDIKRLQYGNRSCSERDTERLRYGYRIGLDRDWIWLPSVLNSLPNGITRDTQDNYHEIITEISQGQISLPKDFTWRSRGLPEALPYQATDRDAYRITYRRIKKQWPNGIPNWMRCLPRWPREVDRERTEAIIRMTFTEKRATETTKCRIKRWWNPHLQSGFPRAEARSYCGEYDHLLWKLMC